MSDFNSLIAEVKSNSDIVNICEKNGINLTQNGYRAKGLCPFHQERTPSFVIDEQSQTYHCFGCGESGDVLSFIQKITNTDFIDALRIVGQENNIDVEKKLAEIYNNDDVNIVDYKTMRACVDKASQYYADKFSHLSNNHPAKKIIIDRGFNLDNTSEYFGYAGKKPNDLTNYLLSQGFTIDNIVESGLARKVVKDDKEMVFDVFTNRLLFSFTDQMGRIVGFSGRKLDEDDFGGKYVNTSDTPIFHKGSLIYNLSNARKSIGSESKVYIVEGQFDVLALKVSGIENVVAVSGTSITDDHIKILNRAVGKNGEFIFCLDGDSAGIKAMRTTLEKHKIAQNKGFAVLFPPNADPCTIYEKKGSKTLVAYLNSRRKKASSEFIVDICVQGQDLSTALGKQKSLSNFSEIADTIGKGAFIELCASNLGNKLSMSMQAILNNVDFSPKRDSVNVAHNAKNDRKLFSLIHDSLSDDDIKNFESKYQKLLNNPIGSIEVRLFVLLLRFPGLVKEHGEPLFNIKLMSNIYDISSELPYKRKMIVEEYGKYSIFVAMFLSDDNLFSAMHLMSTREINDHYNYLLKRRENTINQVKEMEKFKKMSNFLISNNDIPIKELRKKILSAKMEMV